MSTGIDELLARQAELRLLLKAATQARDEARAAARVEPTSPHGPASSPVREKVPPPDKVTDGSAMPFPHASGTSGVEADASLAPISPHAARTRDPLSTPPATPPPARAAGSPGQPTPEVLTAAVTIQSRLRGTMARNVAVAEAEVAELGRGLTGVELQLHFLRDQANQITARMAAASAAGDGEAGAGEEAGGGPAAVEDVYEPFCGSRQSSVAND